MKSRNLAGALLALAFLCLPPAGYAADKDNHSWVVTAPDLFRQTRSLAIFSGIVESKGKEINADTREMITEGLQDIALLATEATLTRYNGFLVKTPQQVRIQYGTSSLPIPAPVAYWGQFEKEDLKDCPVKIAHKVQQKLKADAFVVFHVVFWSTQIDDLIEHTSGTSGGIETIFSKRWQPTNGENIVAISCQLFDSRTGKQIAHARQARAYGMDMLLLSQTAWRNASSLAAELVSLKMEDPG